MFLHEDKAYCFGAAEFQTVLGANSTNASMSKGVQRCWQCFPPAAAAMDQHCRDCLHSESPHIFTQTFLTIVLAPFPICCEACGQVWCTLLGGKPAPVRRSPGAVGRGSPEASSSPCHGPRVWLQQGRSAASLMQKRTHQRGAQEQSGWQTTKFSSNCTERKFRKFRIDPEEVPNCHRFL